MKRVARYLSVVSLFLAVLAIQAWPIEPMPLPDFELTSVDGQPVRSSQLSLQDRWLMIYIKPNCLPCESLLHILKKDPDSPEYERVAIVVGGMGTNDLKKLMERFPDLNHASWYADISYLCSVQLRLKGVPVVLAGKQNTILWSIHGVLPNAKDLRSILTSWIKRP